MAKILYSKPTLLTFHDFKFGNCSYGSAAAPSKTTHGQCGAGGSVNREGYCNNGVCAPVVQEGSGTSCSIGYEADCGAAGIYDCSQGICAADCSAGTGVGAAGTTCGAGNGASESY